MYSTTTCAALHDQDTIPNGRGWYKEELPPADGKIYIHIDGPSWNPVSNGSGRWFGNFCPKNQREARAFALNP